MQPYLSELHLDYGCGDGVFTRALKNLQEEGIMVGYDISPDQIKACKSLGGDKMYYTSSTRNMRPYQPFRSATLNFVLHETEDSVLEDVYNVLAPGGLLAVMDYHLKGKNQSDFRDIFIAQQEQKEIEEMGFHKAFAVHTAKNLADCIHAAEKRGFETEHSETFGGKYFLWVGKKSFYQ